MTENVKEKQAVIIPKDAVFYATSGAFSDYDIKGVFKALQDIDIEFQLSDYLKQYPREKGITRFDESKLNGERFFIFLFRRNLFELIQSYELHLNYAELTLHEGNLPGQQYLKSVKGI